MSLFAVQTDRTTATRSVGFSVAVSRVPSVGKIWLANEASHD